MPLSVAILADLELPRDLKISGDGKYTTYITQAASRSKSAPKTTIWLAEVGKKYSSRRWTKGDHLDTSPSFSPTGTQLAFLSDRGTENSDMDLYYLSIAEPNVVQKAIPCSGYGTIETFRWNHTGGQIALSIRPRTDPDVDVKVHDSNIRYRNLWLFDVETGINDGLHNENADVSHFAWKNDSSEIVFCTQAHPDTDSANYGMKFKVLNRSTRAVSCVAETHHNIMSVCWSERGIFIYAYYALVGMNHSLSVLRLKDNGFEDVTDGETEDVVGLQTSLDGPMFHIHRGMYKEIRTLDENPLRNSEGPDSI